MSGLIADPPAEAVAVNVNVPNLPLEQINRWRRTSVGNRIPRSMAAATLEPKEGHEGAFHVRMQYGDPIQLPVEIDGGAVEAGEGSITYLSKLEGVDVGPGTSAERILAACLSR